MARQKVQPPPPPPPLGNKKETRGNTKDERRKLTAEDTSKKPILAVYPVYLGVFLGIIAICLQFMRPQVNNYYPSTELMDTVQKLTEKLEYFHVTYSRELEHFHQRIHTIDTRMKDIDKVTQEQLEKYDNKLLNARGEMAESAIQIKHYIGIVNELESMVTSSRSMIQSSNGGKIANHEIEILRNGLEILNENIAIEKSAVVSKMKKLTRDGRRDRDKIDHLSESLETMTTSIVTEIRIINNSLIDVKDMVSRGKSECVSMINKSVSQFNDDGTSLENTVNRTARKMAQQEDSLQAIQNTVDGIARELNNYVSLIKFKNETEILKSELQIITNDLSKKSMGLNENIGIDKSAQLNCRNLHATVQRLKVAVHNLQNDLIDSRASWENMNITVTSVLACLSENRKSGQENMMLLLKKLQKKFLNYRGQQTYLQSHVSNMTDDIKKLSEERKLWNYFIDARMNSLQDSLQYQNVSIFNMVAMEIKRVQNLVSFRDALSRSPMGECNTSGDMDAKNIDALTDQFRTLLEFKIGVLQAQLDGIRENMGYVGHHGDSIYDTKNFVEFIKFTLRSQLDSIRREMITKQAKFEQENAQYLEARLRMLENEVSSLKSDASVVNPVQRGDDTCDSDVIGYVESRLNLLRSQMQILGTELETQKSKTNENWKIHVLQWQLEQANSMLLEHERRLNKTAQSINKFKKVDNTYSANLSREDLDGMTNCHQKSVEFEHYLMSADERMDKQAKHISETLRVESDNLNQYIAFYNGLRDGELRGVRKSLDNHDQVIHVLQEQLSQREKAPSFLGFIHQQECHSMMSQVYELADKYEEVESDLKKMYDFQRFLEFLHQSDYETMSARTSELVHQHDVLAKLVEEQKENQALLTENINYLLHEQGRKTAEIMKKLKTVIENNKVRANNEVAFVNHTISMLIRDLKKNVRKQEKMINQLQKQNAHNSKSLENLLRNNPTSDVNTSKVSRKKSKSTKIKTLDSKPGNIEIETQHLTNLETNAHMKVLARNDTDKSLPPYLLNNELESVASVKHNTTKTSKENVRHDSP
uniref:Interaptin-like n=1 Tax=Saccoglossus kowalevskii TaxID=10224 RepID=A0ABM0LWK0_SACKO|nr:PREDICTED: interaptin-like [Saccoglossus kowalevskii]